ncbi:hypothetical protein SLEP1_g31926 [Rubroshorea leprosula]|uniref:Leucine-rich repeat-containing N-terminal plant-type domain-containing protein n=1 Tax=Rubroshorea leprosula TaxID=152421 RepID=A0AAV5KBQ4_9ROSI|nr:hypothetical protein SLEP1_g31926 [Rubroshorea leprosula]
MLLLAIIFFQINVVLASGHCQSDQQEFLLQLKNNLHFHSDVSLKLMKWNQSVDCCTWEGVTCDVRGLVTDLDLSNEWIVDGMDNSSSLFNLQHLRSVNLANNNFSSIFPLAFDKLSNLRDLNLSNAGFKGQIAEVITNLTQLVSLDFSSNSFSGPIPSFSFAKNLTHLNLAYNQLNGSILSTNWSSLSKLEFINLRDNALSGTLPVTLFEIPSLQSLVLSQNQFTGELHETPELASSTLQSLELDGNMLNGSLPVSVFGLQSLQVLILSSNNFSGPLNLNSILNLTNLSTLDLSFNSLSINATISDPASFPLIHTLKLASCKLKRFPNFLEEKSKLSILDLSANQIDGEIPDWVWTKSSLGYLNLSYNFLVNLQGPLQAPSSSLSILDLRGNKFQGQLPKLSSDLAYVDYSSNNFSSMIQFYNSSGTFSFILLSNNNLQGSIPESICDATNLQVLDLSNNSLNGAIPQCLNEMESLNVLDLSRNNLSGNISDKFSSNCSLQTLNLTRNHLEGKVPRSLTNCARLEVLDLGNNKISDTFPCHLKNMSKLKVLVLRYNNFYESINCLDDKSSSPPLQIVDLASNHFKGELPYRWLHTWKAMKFASDELEVLVLEENVRFELDHNHLDPYRPVYGCYAKDRSVLSERAPDSYSAMPSPISYIPSPKGNVRVCSDVYGHEGGSNIFSQGIYYRYAATITIKGSETRLVKILSLLTSIDFSCNKFEGQIPEVLGEFKALYALNLSHNDFTGLIPSFLGKLQYLESLDLSSNNLSGEIPQQLGDLNFLAVLNLSHNQLEGRIPSGMLYHHPNTNIHTMEPILIGIS